MINVLISTYNGAEYISMQLDSIVSQTLQDFHIYIRDDGSTDETVKVVEDYVEQHDLADKLSIEAGKNIGFCASFLKLLAQVEDGQYWAFCDQDDVWMPEKLKNAYDWLRQQDDDRPLLYHGGFAIGNEDLSVQTPYPCSKFPYQFYNAITSNIFFGFSMVVNRKLREMLLLVDPDHIKYHDWFAAIITAAFGKYHMSGQIEAVHRQYSHNASPLFFFKKIPHGWRMLMGDRFYTMQAREFKRLYGSMLSYEDQKLLEWFQMDRYQISTALRKAFYPKRWNPQIKVELILRVLMLFGVL